MKCTEPVSTGNLGLWVRDIPPGGPRWPLPLGGDTVSSTEWFSSCPVRVVGSRFSPWIVSSFVGEPQKFHSFRSKPLVYDVSLPTSSFPLFILFLSGDPIHPLLRSLSDFTGSSGWCNLMSFPFATPSQNAIVLPEDRKHVSFSTPVQVNLPLYPTVSYRDLLYLLPLSPEPVPFWGPSFSFYGSAVPRPLSGGNYRYCRFSTEPFCPFFLFQNLS